MSSDSDAHGDDHGQYTYPTQATERPQGPFVAVAAEAETVTRALGEACFAPNWATSTVFCGENVNLVRRSYEDVDGFDIPWWQVHVRGWQRADGGLWLRAHFEPSARDHPVAHAQEAGYDVAAGMRALIDALDAAGVPIDGYYDTVDAL